MSDGRWIADAARIDPGLDSRAATFENPSGARGAGGASHGGRKGAPSRRVRVGERVVLADLDGPGVVRHVWMTFPPARPERMRAVLLEVFYDGADEPSVSVPCLDFFGLPHGRPVAYHSALTAVNEGRGFNSYVPMPFRDGIRIELLGYRIPACEAEHGRRPMNRVGLTHLAFRVGDLDDLCRRIEAEGGTVLPATTATFEHGNRGVMTLDPDGIRVELIERPAP